MKSILILVTGFGLNCQAGLTDMVRTQLCNKNGSFEHGMNDGRGGKPMSSSFANLCDNSIREEIEKSYHDGYMTGVQTQNTNNKNEININVASAGNGSAKRVFCELKPFMSSFSAWGASELEAKIKVKEKCTKQYNEMHCENYDCKQAD